MGAIWGGKKKVNKNCLNNNKKVTSCYSEDFSSEKDALTHIQVLMAEIIVYFVIKMCFLIYYHYIIQANPWSGSFFHAS